MMPGIDGIETLKRIRVQKSASVLPIIMVTAKVESANIVDALEQGANDYVTKPVDFAVASWWRRLRYQCCCWPVPDCLYVVSRT